MDQEKEAAMRNFKQRQQKARLEKEEREISTETRMAREHNRREI